MRPLEGAERAASRARGPARDRSRPRRDRRAFTAPCGKRLLDPYRLGRAGRGARRTTAMTSSSSANWNATFRAAYSLIRALDPLLRGAWATGGLGITSRLTVRGRVSGRERSVLVGLIQVDGRWYVGHPNGEVSWTANLRSAGRARIAPRSDTPLEVTARPLDLGPERDAVIWATADQQPFPANLLYRAARRHILRVGCYFRVEEAANASRRSSRERYPGGRLDAS